MIVHSRRLSRRSTLAGFGAIGLGAALSPGWNPALAQDASPSADGDYPEVVITAADYSLTLPATLPGGFTKLTLDNQGGTGHHAMFMKLNDGVTADEFSAVLAAPEFGPLFGLSVSLGGPEVDPGLQASVILDLLPGSYVVLCLIPDEEGIPHYMHGMHALLDVTDAVERPAPTADAKVELVDFGFGDMPMEATAGTHVWEVANAGEQLHEFLVMRIADGVTFEDIQAMLAAPPGTPAPAGPPPYAIVGGAAPMSPGEVNWAILELEAGEYFSICFVPDPASGAPHFALGMIMPLTVA